MMLLGKCSCSIWLEYGHWYLGNIKSEKLRINSWKTFHVIQVVWTTRMRNEIRAEPSSKVWVDTHPNIPVIPGQEKLSWLHCPFPQGPKKWVHSPVHWLPLGHQKVFVQWWLVLSGATLFLHAVSTFPLIFSLASRHRPNGNKLPPLAPFPEKLYLVPKSSRPQNGVVLWAKNGHPEGAWCNSDPGPRNRTLWVNDYCLLPGVLLSSPHGGGQV